MSYLPPHDERNPRFQQRYPSIPHSYLYPHPQSAYYPVYHQPIPRFPYEDPYFPKYELGVGPAAYSPTPLAEAAQHPNGLTAGDQGAGGSSGEGKREREREKERERDRERGRGYDYDVQLPFYKRFANSSDRVVAWFYRSMMLKNKRLLNYLRIACAITPVVTTLFCYAVGMFLGHSFSKYPIPYLSYTGADTPEKFFFVVGNTGAAIMFLPVLFVNQAGIVYVRGGTRFMCFLSHFGLIVGAAAACFLSLLSIFDTVHYKSIHYAFAMSFFVCSFVWALSEATCHFIWFRNEPKNYFLKKAIVVKYIILVVLFSVLVAYVSTTSDKACSYQMDLSAYDRCPTSQTIGAVTQYCLLGLILFYISTLSFKKYEESVLARDYDPYKTKPNPSFTELLSEFKDTSRSSKLSASLREVSTGGAGGGGGATESGQFSSEPGRLIEKPRKSIDSGKASVEMDVDDLPSSPPPPQAGPSAPSSAPSAPTAATSSTRGLSYPNQPFIEAIPEEGAGRPSTSSQRIPTKPLGTNRSTRSLLPNPNEDSSDESYLASLRSGSSSRRKFSLTSDLSRSSIELHHGDPNRSQPLNHYKSVVDLRHNEPSAPVLREEFYEMQERLAAAGKRRPSVETSRRPYEAPYNPHLGAPLDPSVFQSRPF